MIREATTRDALHIARLVDEWACESTGEFPPPDPIHTVAWVGWLLEYGKVWISEGTTAVCAIAPQALPWSPEAPILKDQFMFVRRSYRHRGLGHALLSEALRYARGRGVNFYAGMASGIDVKHAEQFYIDHGGHPLGGGAFLFKTGE